MSNLKLSFCITCKGRRHHLEQTLLRNLEDNVDLYSEDQNVEFVVLDYSSPDGLTDWMLNSPEFKPYFQSGVLRLAGLEGQEHFYHSHAKNIAHKISSGDIVCNLDADNFTGPGFGRYLQSVFAGGGSKIVFFNIFDGAYKGPDYKGATGRVALLSRDFHELGGYDETPRFGGWAGEDGDLIIRAIRKGLRPVLIKDRERYMKTIPHDNSLRVCFCSADDRAHSLKTMEMMCADPVLPKILYFVDRLWASKVANPNGYGKGRAKVVSVS